MSYASTYGTLVENLHYLQIKTCYLLFKYMIVELGVLANLLFYKVMALEAKILIFFILYVYIYIIM
jgi:hypothetical protein